MQDVLPSPNHNRTRSGDISNGFPARNTLRTHLVRGQKLSPSSRYTRRRSDLAVARLCSVPLLFVPFR